jgi:hydrogenase maturation protease
VLVAAFGHAWLKDQAFGIKVIARVRELGVPDGVELADWSFSTITAFQRLSEHPYVRAVFVSGVARGRRPGTLHRFLPPGELPPREEIQARIGDGVMGLVHVDNLLAVGRYYGRLPEDVVLIEAEPADETWGDELSPRVAPLLDVAVGAVLEEIRRPMPPARLPCGDSHG